METIPDHITEAAAEDAGRTPADKLEALVTLGDELRECEALVSDLKARLAAEESRRHRLTTQVIPEKLDEAGVGAIELIARGNRPAARVEVVALINANIAAAWPLERRQAAFDWLDANGQGDLIKTTLIARLPRERRVDALTAAQSLRDALGVDVEVAEAVSSMTLTAWLKERVKSGLSTPLDVVGGFVGRVAKLKITEK